MRRFDLAVIRFDMRVIAAPLLGFPAYVERCQEVVAKGYEGFVLA